VIWLADGSEQINSYNFVSTITSSTLLCLFVDVFTTHFVIRPLFDLPNCFIVQKSFSCSLGPLKLLCISSLLPPTNRNHQNFKGTLHVMLPEQFSTLCLSDKMYLSLVLKQQQIEEL
jgi:hypothetical protein